MSMIKSEIQALADRGNVTLQEWDSLRMNSWERELILLELTDAAFMAVAQRMIKECCVSEARPCATYNDAVAAIVAPELIRRLASTNDARVRDAVYDYVDAHKALDEAGIPRDSASDEMPPGVELSLTERIKRLRYRK